MAESNGPEKIGQFTFTEDEIIRFAQLYDPQLFHTDPKAAERGMFGVLIASGWHVAMAWMGCFVRHTGVPADYVEGEETDEARILCPVGVGISCDKMRWHAPVRVNDTIIFDTEVLSRRASSSRPGWEVVFRRSHARREDGTLVMSHEITHLMPVSTPPAGT